MQRLDKAIKEGSREITKDVIAEESKAAGEGLETSRGRANDDTC